jgi:predicted permease
MSRRSPALTAALIAISRAVVRAVLMLHPRDFRRVFGAEVLDDVGEDVRRAGRQGWLAAARAAAAATSDAVRGLRANRGGAPARPHPPEARPFVFEDRTMTRRSWLPDIWSDVRLGARALRRERAFTTAIVLLLALGVGANAAMFGVVDRLLLGGPDHVRDPGRVRRLQSAFQPAGRDLQRTGSFGYTTYTALRQSRTFARVAAYSVTENGALFGRGLAARRVVRGEATASLFPLLGVTPAAGRFFTEEEDAPAAAQRVVVLGYGLWQRDFGGRHDVIGTSIALDDRPFTIVGVAPNGFTGPDLGRVDVWMPVSLLGPTRVTNWVNAWNAWWLSIVVRLEPGVTTAHADAEATAVYRSAYGGNDAARAKATLSVQPLVHTTDGIQSMESRVSVWLLAITGIVLVVSCANIVNLVLARQVRRRREMAVRLALGAGRGRLVRLLVAESAVLSLAGGAAGLAVAYGAGAVLRARLLPGVEWSGSPVNARVLVAAMAAALLAGPAVSLLPAWFASASHLAAALRTGEREGRGRQGRTRAALTLVQTSLSALLLVGSGLFVVSLERIRAMDLGLEPERVLTFSVQRTSVTAIADAGERQRERDRRASFYPMVLERLGQRPDVEAASLAIGLPFGVGFGDDIRVPGRAGIPELKGGGPFVNAVTSEYFRTVGTRIVRGRSFTADDRAGSAPVVVVNETMAATLWPNEDALGRCFSIGQSPACAEVVGVAADTRRFQLREDEAMWFYLPLGQEQGLSGTQLLVRPAGDANQLLADLKRTLIDLDPTIRFVNAAVLQDRVDAQLRPWQLGAAVFSVMGVLALVVAAVGLYSLMSYVVAYRAHEIGVRMALGARPADVVRLVVREGLTLAAAGVVTGFALALAAAGPVEPLLFDTSPREPIVFAAVAVTLLAMAVAATLLPAARARRVSPVEAMRAE